MPSLFLSVFFSLSPSKHLQNIYKASWLACAYNSTSKAFSKEHICIVSDDNEPFSIRKPDEKSHILVLVLVTGSLLV